MTPPMNHNKIAGNMPVALAAFLPLNSIFYLPWRLQLVLDLTPLTGIARAPYSDT